MFERYVYTLQTRQGIKLATIPVVLSCQISGNTNRQVKWDGQISLIPARIPNWQGICETLNADSPLIWQLLQLRIEYQKNNEALLPLGVFVMEATSTQAKQTPTGAHVQVSLNLYDLTKIPANDASGETHTETAGALVTQAIQKLLESTQDMPPTITHNNATLRTNLVWDPGTTKLTIINDLLQATGYNALYTSPSGQYQITPYQPPRQRPIQYDYTTRPHYPSITTSHPATRINKVTLLAKGDGTTPDLTATAVNRQDYDQTGTWRTLYESNIEAANQDILNQLAEKKLSEASKSTWTRTRKTPVCPLALNDVILGADGIEVVEEINLTCAAGQMLEIKTRQAGN